MFLPSLWGEKYFRKARVQDVWTGREKSWVFDLGGWMYTFVMVEMLVVKFAHVEYFF